jgi:CRISPR/Cas system-associated endonuclease Cas1
MGDQFQDNWNSIEQRSSPFHLAGNRNATHPVNAMLNYAYTFLESGLRSKAIDGIDVSVGALEATRRAMAERVQTARNRPRQRGFDWRSNP